ncbi:hypothetical protein [Escherichia coli]|uniref:hypothetical protein n=1 Tax=Escherichia coli TaxID=562 RepID=UPI000A7B7864
MSYPLFDKDEHWHKPEQAFLTDDHRTILRFAVEALMSGKRCCDAGGDTRRRGRPLGAQMVVPKMVVTAVCLWRLRGGRCRF